MNRLVPRVISQHWLLSWGSDRLVRAGKGKHEARLLLEWALDVDSLLRAPVFVGQRAAERYRSAIAQRCQGFPLQHITGRMQFRGLRLQAGPGVFVVRPETELLVDFACQDLPEAPRIADLCAGSGALGLAFASEIPEANVTAVELSPEAMAYARRNTERLRLGFAPGSNYKLVEADATTALAGQEASFDVVVANPPYVPGQPALTGEVLFDPEMALYGGGEDGLVIPRGIVVRSLDLLVPGGYLLMEHAPEQSAELRSLASDSGFVFVQTLEDLTGRQRFLRAKKKDGSDE